MLMWLLPMALQAKQDCCKSKRPKKLWIVYVKELDYMKTKCEILVKYSHKNVIQQILKHEGILSIK